MINRKSTLSLIITVVCLLAAILAFLAFLASWVSPITSGLITYAALGIPVILAINLMIGIYWIIVKKRWAILPFAAILLNFGYLSAIFQISFSNREKPQHVQSLKVATYNVGNFRSWDKFDSYHHVANYFINNHVDIACFQEYSERKYMNADSLGQRLNLPYHSVAYLANSTTNGSAIFSKYPIVSEGKLFETLTNDATWADIRFENQIIRIINCHLQTTNFNRKSRNLKKPAFANANAEQVLAAYSDISSTLLNNSIIRAKQAEIMRNFIDTSPYPVIVCGDFNDPPSSYTYHQIKGQLKDSFRSNGKGYGYTFRGLRRLLRIDYILYSTKFECTKYLSENKDWSDHNPVICELYLE